MRLLLDEHFAPLIAEVLRERGHDAVAEMPSLRGESDERLLSTPARSTAREVDDPPSHYTADRLRAKNAEHERRIAAYTRTGLPAMRFLEDPRHRVVRLKRIQTGGELWSYITAGYEVDLRRARARGRDRGRAARRLHPEPRRLRRHPRRPPTGRRPADQVRAAPLADRD